MPMGWFAQGAKEDVRSFVRLLVPLLVCSWVKSSSKGNHDLYMHKLTARHSIPVDDILEYRIALGVPSYVSAAPYHLEFSGGTLFSSVYSTKHAVCQTVSETV